jgi:hypothetical protein
METNQNLVELVKDILDVYSVCPNAWERNDCVNKLQQVLERMKMPSWSLKFTDSGLKLYLDSLIRNNSVVNVVEKKEVVTSLDEADGTLDFGGSLFFGQESSSEFFSNF